MAASTTPTLMPVLSAGRHRSPRQGACFMEFASYLAGERWSDRPACTHATLAALARDINDLSTDAGRARLTTLIHRVVGLTPEDPGFGMSVALIAARAALPVANLERQRALAVALLSFDPELGPASRAAFDQSPDLERWARGFLSTTRYAPKASRRTAESIVHTAVTGIATACIEDADERLLALLTAAIEEAEGYSVSLTMSSMTQSPFSLTR